MRRKTPIITTQKLQTWCLFSWNLLSMGTTHRGTSEFLQHKVPQFRKSISQRDLKQTEHP